MSDNLNAPVTGLAPAASGGAGTLPPTASPPSEDHQFALSDSAALLVAETTRTPCFAYRLDIARQRFLTLRAALPDRVHLAYAVKSNPGAPLLAELARQGAWFDCASAGEVAAVQMARDATQPAGGRAQGSPEAPGQAPPGVPGPSEAPGRMVFAGPAKSEADLRAALAAGARIQVDGIEDVQRLTQWHHGSRPLPVSVRVHPLEGVRESAAIIGGSGPSAFGVDEEDLPDFLAACADHPSVQVTGLQVFSASNELDAQALLANHRTALGIGEQLQTLLGRPLDLIDLGGGLGIPYSPDSPELDVTALGTGLAELLAEHLWFTGNLVLEPGRWLSGPTGVYLTRVVRVKQSRGTTFAILEGGINHLLRPLMTGQSFPVRAVPVRRGSSPTNWADEPDAAEEAGELTAYTLAGPLCTSLDRVGRAELAPLHPGDLLVLGQAGAYGFTQAMTHFLSHPVPEQVWLGGSLLG